MSNNNFENIPRPKYVKEYRKFGNVFKSNKYGEKSYLDKFLVQSFISLLTVAVVLLINNINMDFTNTISKGIKTAINWNMDFSKALGTFSDFKNIIPEVKENSNEPVVLPESYEDIPSFIMPVEGEITSEYGERIHPVFKTVKMHTGIDIYSPIGTPIKSSTSGTVLSVGEDAINGKYARIKSGNYEVVYAHCYSISVSEGQSVNQGDILGEVGDTGITSGPHLHFEIQEEGKAINPMDKLMGVQ